MASKPSQRLHLQRLVERNQLSAAEQCQILQTIENPSRAFLERVSKRGTPAKVSRLADKLLTSAPSPKANLESLSGEGPLEPDLIYRYFLDASEIEQIYAAALPEARYIYYDLLGVPDDPTLAQYWCDVADVLGVGCSRLKNGTLDPTSIGLRLDVVGRILDHEDEVAEWHRNRWKEILERRDKENGKSA